MKRRKDHGCRTYTLSPPSLPTSFSYLLGDNPPQTEWLKTIAIFYALTILQFGQGLVWTACLQC